MDEPYRYFKFRQVNKRLFESLANQTIYFSSPDKLNDPFDCQPDIHKSLAHAASLANSDHIRKLLANLAENRSMLKHVQERVKTVGLFCCSLDMHQTLLWSHYADGHKGVCLLYEFKKDFLDNGEEFIGASEVSYSANNISEWIGLHIEKYTRSRFVLELSKVLLTAKAPEWSYEKEARIIRPKSGLLPIPSGSLKQVCFGLRTPETDKNTIMKLASHYSGCESFAHMVRSASDFGTIAI